MRMFTRETKAFVVALLLRLASSATEQDWTASVNRVNYLRRLHFAGPVKIADDLNFAAQDWANQMAEDSLWMHSFTPYGENIAGAWCSSKDKFDSIDKNDFVVDAANRWYDEVKAYDFNNQGWSLMTGHFTQLVWRSTNEIGIGVSYNEKTKAVYVVMNYWPTGNLPSGFSVNVMRAATPPPPPPSPPIKVMTLNGAKMPPKKNQKMKPPPRKLRGV